MRKLTGIILLVLAAFMLFIGISMYMLPPTLTGCGFIAIGLMYLMEKQRT